MPDESTNISDFDFMSIPPEDYESAFAFPQEIFVANAIGTISDSDKLLLANAIRENGMIKLFAEAIKSIVSAKGFTSFEQYNRFLNEEVMDIVNKYSPK